MSAVASEPLFLAGPTGVGKSEVALLLAEQGRGEIVSVDSMQVYRGMDIGTAKPGPEERRRVPHHLLDVVEVTESFDAARFIALAREAESGIRQRGHLPVFCGGTGLYFRAYLHGLGDGPAPDPELRRELESVPLARLLEELGTGDPAGFQTIDRGNPRRVIRAVEVLRLTGQPASARRADWASGSTPAGFFALGREPGDLRRRIEGRVERMFGMGLVDEVRVLLDRGLAGNRTALQALGYRQVTEFLEGKRSLEETRELVKIRTWQFARRQATWFRRQLRPQWIHVVADETPAETAGRIRKALVGRASG